MAAEQGPESTVEVEELDPLELLRDTEATLQQGLRRARSFVFRQVPEEEPTKLETLIQARPVIAAAVAGAAGYALGFALRRVIPFPLRRGKKK